MHFFGTNSFTAEIIIQEPYEKMPFQTFFILFSDTLLHPCEK